MCSTQESIKSKASPLELNVITKSPQQSIFLPLRSVYLHRYEMPTRTSAPVSANPGRSQSSAAAAHQKTTKQCQQKDKTKAVAPGGQVPTKRLRCQQTTLALITVEENKEFRRRPLKVIATNPASKKLPNPQTCSICTACKTISARSQKVLPDILVDLTRAEPPPATTSLPLPATPKVPECFVDPDSDVRDPQLCAEYAKDIYNNLLAVERKEIYLIEAGFLQSSRFTVKPQHRSILINWLFQVQQRCALLNETMYLCVDILDRVFQVEPTIPKNKLQLVGVTALFIASKFEEIYPPLLSEFVHLTDNAYTVKEVLAKEIDILQKLDYQLNRPFPLHFLRRYSSVMGTSMKIHQLAKYILELSLLDHVCSCLMPSKRAAAALILAAGMLSPGKSPFSFWDKNMTYVTKYKCSDFDEEKLKLKKALREGHGSPKMAAIRKKYRDTALSNPATLTALARL